MAEDPIWSFIVQRVKDAGYNSVNFDLALVKEEELWKILVTRIIFDMGHPWGRKTLLKQTDFAIEHFSLPLEEFQRFFEYLKQSNLIGNTKMQEVRDYNPSEFFEIFEYKLRVNGNFPNKSSSFLGRQRAKSLRGIDRPIHYFDYYLGNSSTPKSYLNIDVSAHEIPFTSVFDAINHYWHTNWQQFHLSSVNCGIYLPIFDASIKNVEFAGNHFSVDLDLPPNYKNNGLSVGVNTSRDEQQFAQKFPVEKHIVRITMPFKPTFTTLFLHRDKEKLDEYYWSPPESTNKSVQPSNLPKDKDERLKHLDIFLSHSNTQKELAGDLKRRLEDLIECEVFLAHEDLEGGEVWAEGLQNRIKNCSHFLVLLSREYHKSEYTDQESGMAYAYGRTIIPVSIDETIPYGFMNKYQTIKASKLDKQTISEIARQIISKDIPPEDRIDHYIELLSNAYSFNNAIFLSELLPYDYEYSREQINKLANILIENDQVHGSIKASPLVEDILINNESLIDNELRTKLSKFLD